MRRDEALDEEAHVPERFSAGQIQGHVVAARREEFGNRNLRLERAAGVGHERQLAVELAVGLAHADLDREGRGRGGGAPVAHERLEEDRLAGAEDAAGGEDEGLVVGRVDEGAVSLLEGVRGSFVRDGQEGEVAFPRRSDDRDGVAPLRVEGNLREARAVGDGFAEPLVAVGIERDRHAGERRPRVEGRGPDMGGARFFLQEEREADVGGANHFPEGAGLVVLVGGRGTGFDEIGAVSMLFDGLAQGTRDKGGLVAFGPDGEVDCRGGHVEPLGVVPVVVVPVAPVVVAVRLAHDEMDEVLREQARDDDLDVREVHRLEGDDVAVGRGQVASGGGEGA